MQNFNISKQAEDYVVLWMRHQNWLILQRNYRRVGCEIDIIAIKRKTIIFVEVKFRKFTPHTMQDFHQMITYKKRKALERGARSFMQSIEGQIPYWETLRFDLAVVGFTKGKLRIQNYIAGI